MGEVVISCDSSAAMGAKLEVVFGRNFSSIFEIWIKA